MEPLIGNNAAIGYNRKDLTQVYFNSDGRLGVIEFKTIGVALGVLGLLSLAFLPFPLGIIGSAAGLAAFYFSVRRLGNLRSIREFDNINHAKNVEKEGVFHGTVKTASQGIRAAKKVVSEASSHASSGINALTNVEWKVLRTFLNSN